MCEVPAEQYRVTLTYPEDGLNGNIFGSHFQEVHPIVFWPVLLFPDEFYIPAHSVITTSSGYTLSM